MIKDALAQAQVFRRDLKQLVVREKLKALLKAHLLGRDEAQRFVGAGGAGVGQVLGAAHVDRHVVGLRAHADDHARVYLGARRDEHLAALLRVPNAVGHGLAGLKRDEGAGIAAGDVALINVVLLKHGGEDAFALGVGKELVAVAERPRDGTRNSIFMRLPTGVISRNSPLREPSFSMTEPMESCGTSTTTRSIGSHFLPSIS